MTGNERFIYNQSFDLNSIIFNTDNGIGADTNGVYKFIHGEEYIFGYPRSNNISLYGTFTHINHGFIGGSYDYYTSICITIEHYHLIKLVCLNDGWISIR